MELALEIIGGHILGNVWKISWGHVMFVCDQKMFIITDMDSFSFCQSLPIIAFLWSLISMDFMMDLSLFESYDSILVVVEGQNQCCAILCFL